MKDNRSAWIPFDDPGNLEDHEVYIFKDSGDGNSWLLGDDSGDYANAFKGGYEKCPVDIIVPRSLTSKDGETRPVEVIGEGAYYLCGNPEFGDKTKTVFVTKQVRIIKNHGFGAMHNVESFRIEEGSVLQSIDLFALYFVGFYSGRDYPLKRGTLILPSTLSDVNYEGIFKCNIFNVIIYCGTHSLTKESSLYEEGDVEATIVKVTDHYPADNIFGYYTPLKDSSNDIEEQCFYYWSDFKYEETEQGAVITGCGNETHSWCPINFIIPEKINGSNVIAVNDSAFANCDTKSPISLPSTLKKIGAFAFANTSHATSITCNSMELEIGEFAFQNCGSGEEQLINMSLPLNIKTEKGAFFGAKIGEVYIM